MVDVCRVGGERIPSCKAWNYVHLSEPVSASSLVLGISHLHCK